MSVFKPLRGTSANLPSTKEDGAVYFCTDTGEMMVDYLDADGAVQRRSTSGTAQARADAAYNLADTAKVNAATAQSKADSAYTLADSKQSKITGVAGQFVVIGDDGNVTTKTIANAEEASF